MKEELERVETLEYNIFRVRDLSGGNEMILTTVTIMLRESLFKILGVNQSVFVNFMQRIQGNYYDVSFHNKTHATDLCQVIFTLNRFRPSTTI